MTNFLGTGEQNSPLIEEKVLVSFRSEWCYIMTQVQKQLIKHYETIIEVHLTRSRDAWKLSHLHPLDSCNVRFRLANNAYVILCSVVWFHTKRKPHNDCHKSGFFTPLFCSATVTVVQVHCTATTPFTCLRLYPYPPSKQHTSIPDQCRCQHQHCWKSIQRCRWTPKSLLAFTKHSEVGYVD